MERGAAGYRLTGRRTSTIPEDLLREFAREALGALRCSQKYLAALRVVLGNMAHADAAGYSIELNQRVDFATPNVMRTIIGQLRASGVTKSRRAVFDGGRSQTVQTYGIVRKPCKEADALDELLAMYRAEKTGWDRGASIDLDTFEPAY